MNIFYEELVTNPEITLKKVCSFIKKDFDNSLIKTEDTTLLYGSVENPINGELKKSFSPQRLQALYDMIDILIEPLLLLLELQ